MAQKLEPPSIAAISKVLKVIISDVFTLSSTSSGKTDEQTAVFWKRQVSEVLSPILSRTNFVGPVTLSVCLRPDPQRGSCTVNWPMRDVAKWRQRKRFKDSWRSAIHTGMGYNEQPGKEHNERLRLVRKERQQDAIGVPTSAELTCPLSLSENLLFPNRTV